MAKAAPASAPTDDDDTDTGAAADTGDGDSGDETAGDMGGGDDAGPTVLLTVMDNGDGTYKLIEGDEPDEDEGDETAAGATGSAAGEDQGAGEGEEAGKDYDSPGALLKGILDILQEHESSAGGEGSSDDQFAAGYAGGSSASPSKPTPLAQKY